MENPLIRSASFDTKVKTYIFIVVLFYLVISVIGWFVLPFWLLGLGQWLSTKFYHTLKCELTYKHLRFSKGLILHIEKTIPLENIQDLSFIGGPILRAFGLTMIRVETAGGGGGHQSNMMSMIGIINAEEFKSLILQQREILIREKSVGQHNSNIQTINTDTNEWLKQIHSELSEIKNLLKTKS